MDPLIRLQGIEKTYRMGDVEVRALRGVTLDIAEGTSSGSSSFMRHHLTRSGTFGALYR